MRGRRGSANPVNHAHYTDHCIMCTSASSHSLMSSAALPAPGAVYHYQPILAIIAVCVRYRSTDFLSCSDMGVRVIGLHSSTDFYIVIKTKVGVRIKSMAYYIGRFMGLYTAYTSHGGHPSGNGKP